MVSGYLSQSRIRYFENEKNTGLGTAINQAIQLAQFELIAYLPAANVYCKDQLQQLWEKLAGDPENVLAVSSICHHYNRYKNGKSDGFWLQLVQCLHKKTYGKWIDSASVQVGI